MSRLSVLREEMINKGLDAAFISSGVNVFYISGFTGFDDATLLITKDKQYIFTDSRYTVQASLQSPEFTAVIKSATDTDAINNCISQDIHVIGFENMTISYSLYCMITKSICSAKWKPLDLIIEDMRNVKDSTEIDLIQRSCDIAVAAFNDILPYIKEGVKESELSCELEYRMKKRGASGVSFDTIVASGKRSSMPHGVASDKLIEYGDTITFDFGCLYGHYCSDMTRTVFVGEAPREMRRIYNIVKESQQAAIDSFKFGMTGRDLDSISRDVITDYGYGAYFGHGLGHGVGIEIHEGVYINRRGKIPLKNNNVFSIEPGIYIEDVGGVRIEDLFYIRNEELINMTLSLPKELIVL